MLIGQAPGWREIETGLPFAWDAGKRLCGWLAVAGLYFTVAWATLQRLEIVHDEKSPILQVPGSLTYACVMGGMVMLALLALLSAKNASTKRYPLSASRIRRCYPLPSANMS